jgi:hypothetical protein
VKASLPAIRAVKDPLPAVRAGKEAFTAFKPAELSVAPGKLDTGGRRAKPGCAGP